MSGLFEVCEPEIPSSLVLAESKEMQEQNVGQKLRYDFRSSGVTPIHAEIEKEPFFYALVSNSKRRY